MHAHREVGVAEAQSVAGEHFAHVLHQCGRLRRRVHGVVRAQAHVKRPRGPVGASGVCGVVRAEPGARDERAAEQAEAEQVQHGQAEALPLRPAVQRDDRGGVLLLRLPCESAGLACERPAEGARRRATGRAAGRAQPSARRPAAERTEATAGRQGGAEYRRACQHHPALRAAARAAPGRGGTAADADGAALAVEVDS